MLKITIVDQPTQRRLTLEGKLISPWIEELAMLWRRAHDDLRGRSVQIDLQNITEVSSAGMSLLYHLMCEGAKFRCSGVFTRHLVDELTHRSQLTGVASCQPTRNSVLQQGATLQISRWTKQEPSEVSICEKYRRLFASKEAGLLQLALILTADPELARECFVQGFEDYSHENSGFQEWTHEWTRRVIVDNALRILSDASTTGSSETSSESHAIGSTFTSDSYKKRLLRRILRLDKCARFVFALTVLENMTDKDCAALLGCSLSDIAPSRARAIEKIAELPDRQ